MFVIAKVTEDGRITDARWEKKEYEVGEGEVKISEVAIPEMNVMSTWNPETKEVIENKDVWEKFTEVERIEKGMPHALEKLIDVLISKGVISKEDMGEEAAKVYEDKKTVEAEYEQMVEERAIVSGITGGTVGTGDIILPK